MPSDGNRQNRRMLDLFPDSARVAEGELAARRGCGLGARRALRDTARRVLRGDPACACARAARGHRCGPDHLRHEGVPQRGACSACSARKESAPTSPRRASSPLRSQPGSRAPSCVVHGNNKSPAFLAAAAAGRSAGRDRRARRGGAGRERRRPARTRAGHASASTRTPTRRSAPVTTARSSVCLPTRRWRCSPTRSAGARRARPPCARRLAARGLRRAGRDDRPARVVRRSLQARARLDGASRRPRRRLRHPPPSRRARDRRGRARRRRPPRPREPRSPRRACPSPRSGSSRVARSSDARA